nr:MAG TPA: hypothetical protein [Bacteriophage sp.]
MTIREHSKELRLIIHFTKTFHLRSSFTQYCYPIGFLSYSSITSYLL